MKTTEHKTSEDLQDNTSAASIPGTTSNPATAATAAPIARRRPSHINLDSIDSSAAAAAAASSVPKKTPRVPSASPSASPSPSTAKDREAATIAGKNAGIQAGAGQIRTLVAEDSLILQKQITRFLGNYGFSVDLAVGAPEAMQKIAANPQYDWVISDHEMPTGTGAQLLQALVTHYDAANNRGQKPAFIMCSAQGDRRQTGEYAAQAHEVDAVISANNKGKLNSTSSLTEVISQLRSTRHADLADKLNAIATAAHEARAQATPSLPTPAPLTHSTSAPEQLAARASGNQRPLPTYSPVSSAGGTQLPNLPEATEAKDHSPRVTIGKHTESLMESTHLEPKSPVIGAHTQAANDRKNAAPKQGKNCCVIL